MLGETELQFWKLSEMSDALIAIFDPADRLRYTNSAFRAAFFIEEGETITWADFLRRNWLAGRGTVIETDNFEAWLASAMSRRGKVPRRTIESSLHDGRWLWIVEAVLPNGWSQFVATDITDLRTEDRELRQLRDLALKASHTDELTGISNRRHIMKLLAEIVDGRHAAKTRTGSACLFDLDHFKKVNDTYGHAIGDTILIDFARTVQSMIHPEDCFGRIGGEEFLLLMPGKSCAAAHFMVERILHAVRKRRPLEKDVHFAYTSSAGLAAIVDGDSPDRVYTRADKALYEAKAEGRNRVKLAG